MSMTTYQSRTGTMKLVTLVVAASVGLVGCSVHPTTPSGSSSAGQTSSSVSARALVDVSAVWATEPLPDCPKLPIVFNGDAPQGITLPDKASVAKQLAGVRSPATETWVRTKLGWVTQALAITRADISDHPTASDANMAEGKGFERYVAHVKSELLDGHDIADPVDGDYPEGCR
ncbi:Uncharacterised protein [Mycobacteroides abscessus subsp. abscessus]|nr:hypothetical protein AWC10_20675 [Mycobacteroides immunogenum]SKL36558.1 Uncharacterised protein [Mycobacteroides abscessus subsp. abscessus]